jgi:hypothetical protein
MEYLPKDAPIWASIIFLLIVQAFNYLPKLGTFLSKHVLPARLKKQEKLLESDLQTRKDDVEWERGRIIRAEKREDDQVEAFKDISKTLLLVQSALEDSNQEHRAIIAYVEKMATRSEEEHKSLVTSMSVLHRLFDNLMTRLEERRKTDVIK